MCGPARPTRLDNTPDTNQLDWGVGVAQKASPGWATPQKHHSEAQQDGDRGPYNS